MGTTTSSAMARCATSRMKSYVGKSYSSRAVAVQNVLEAEKDGVEYGGREEMKCTRKYFPTANDASPSR